MKHEVFETAGFVIGGVYERDQIADTGHVTRRSPRDWTGITTFSNCILLWVTLDKSNKEPDHKYNDRFIDQGRTFLWDTQRRNTLSSSVVISIDAGTPVYLMARLHDKAQGRGVPFVYCGRLINPVHGDEERPVRFRFDCADHRDPAPAALAELYQWVPSGAREISQAEILPDDQRQPNTRNRPGAGQGRVTNSEFKRAVERRAVDHAIAQYRADGWAVEDVGVPGNPFDLLCHRKEATRRVEVKGTSSGIGAVMVTAGEVRSARELECQTDLYVVWGIDVLAKDDELIGEGGQAIVVEDWAPHDAELTATQYTYELHRN